MDFDFEVVDDGLDLWTPGTEIRGGGFDDGDAIIALDVDLFNPDRLQVGDVLAGVSDGVSVGRLKGIEALVHDGVMGGAVAVEVDQALGPLCVVLVKGMIVGI